MIPLMTKLEKLRGELNESTSLFSRRVFPSLTASGAQGTYSLLGKGERLKFPKKHLAGAEKLLQMSLEELRACVPPKLRPKTYPIDPLMNQLEEVRLKLGETVGTFSRRVFHRLTRKGACGFYLKLRRGEQERFPKRHLAQAQIIIATPLAELKSCPPRKTGRYAYPADPLMDLLEELRGKLGESIPVFAQRIFPDFTIDGARGTYGLIKRGIRRQFPPAHLQRANVLLEKPLEELRACVPPKPQYSSNTVGALDKNPGVTPPGLAE